VIRLFSYSLSLRLLAIFLMLAALFAWGVVAGIRWAYSANDLRSLISGHLSLHVDYVRRDIGSPPQVDRALAITQRVPVDIRIDGPGVQWSSDPAFPDPATLTFGPSDYFSSEPGALLDELQGVDFAQADRHNCASWRRQPDHRGAVATRNDRPPLVPMLGFRTAADPGAYLQSVACSVRWRRSRAPPSARATSSTASACRARMSWANWLPTSTPWPTRSRACSRPSSSCCWASATSCARRSRASTSRWR
jgi:hypothetical protein